MRIKRLLRFNLKTLLVVTAILCALLAHEMKRAYMQAQAALAIRRMNGSVGYKALPFTASGELRMLLGADLFATLIMEKEPIVCAFREVRSTAIR